VACAIIFLTFFTSCYKGHLYVQQEWIDRDFLASTHVGTPDPRQERPPDGQRLLVSWRFPKCLYDQQLTLAITVRFWDNKEEVILQPVKRQLSYTALYFPKREGQGKILTYKIDVVNSEGGIVETWEHHFWTELIDIDRKN